MIWLFSTEPSMPSQSMLTMTTETRMVSTRLVAASFRNVARDMSFMSRRAFY